MAHRPHPAGGRARGAAACRRFDAHAARRVSSPALRPRPHLGDGTTHLVCVLAPDPQWHQTSPLVLVERRIWPTLEGSIPRRACALIRHHLHPLDFAWTASSMPLGMMSSRTVTGEVDRAWRRPACDLARRAREGIHRILDGCSTTPDVRRASQAAGAQTHHRSRRSRCHVSPSWQTSTPTCPRSRRSPTTCATRRSTRSSWAAIWSGAAPRARRFLVPFMKWAEFTDRAPHGSSTWGVSTLLRPRAAPARALRPAVRAARSGHRRRSLIRNRTAPRQRRLRLYEPFIGGADAISYEPSGSKGNLASCVPMCVSL